MGIQTLVFLLGYFPGLYFAKGDCWMSLPNCYLLWQIWDRTLEFFQLLRVVEIPSSIASRRQTKSILTQS